MKKINLLLICSTLFLCGCNKPNPDNANIEAVSKKLDAVLQNQSALNGQIQALKAQVSTLPSAKEVNQTCRFYYTNEIDLIARLQTNAVWTVTANVHRDVLSLNQGKTVEPTVLEDARKLEKDYNMEQIPGDLAQIKADISLIKTRLGILY